MTALFTAGALAKAWLATLLMMAAQGTLLALLAFVLARAGKLRPAWQAAIWLVVTVKLALPWGPSMPYSLADAIAMFRDHPAPAPMLHIAPSAPVVATTPDAWPAVGWLLLAALWLLGATWVVVRAVLAHRSTTAAARRAPLAPRDALALIAQLSAGLRVRTPKLSVGDADVGPHVVGLVRTIIVVPPSLLGDEPLLRAALLHELAHVRRRDAVARVIQIIAASIMWWWPVARIVQRRLEAAREAACDAWALETVDVPRAAYARLLVRMASLRHAAAPGLAAHHTPSSLNKRVAAVLGPPARARLSWLHRIALAAWVILALGGARSATAHTHTEACHYTPQLGMALYNSYPQADLDGDGMLSRTEACDLQAELMRDRRDVSSRLTPEAEREMETLLAEPLCCNLPTTEVYSSQDSDTCRNVIGVEP
ncbi:MAG TPA: M56 family metallopeptidase [Kofleriaceae bacterium]|nr:M56 family metallopeptidase [Kofleriaceae bacterium]